MRKNSDPDHTHRSPVLLDGDQADVARESAQLLRAAVQAGLPDPSGLRLLMGDPPTQRVFLPTKAVELLADMLMQLANGDAVSVVALQAELSTQQAAELLGVSRPYLVAMLGRGELAFRRVGNRRRVSVADVLQCRKEHDEEVRTTRASLIRLERELGPDD